MKQKTHSRTSSEQFQKFMTKFQWSMAMNSLQRIINKRCKQPLNDLKNYNIEDHSKVIKRHIRHLSDQIDESMESFKLLDLLKHRRTPTDSFHKQCNSTEFTRVFSHRNRDESSSFFQNEESSKINEEFIALFRDEKDKTFFGILTPKTKVEQEILLKQLEIKKPNKSDINTFIELVKKPNIVIEQQNVIKEDESDKKFNVLLILTLLLLIVIILI